MWRLGALTLLSVLGLASQVRGDVVRDITEDAIRDAIRQGTVTKTGAGAEYALSDSEPIVLLLTPFARIMDRAASAARRYEEITAATLPKDVAEPLFMVIAEPFLVGRRTINIDHVVAIKRDADQESVAQPVRVKKTVTTWSNRLGAKTEGTGVEAWFPMEALTEGIELRIITSDGERRLPITRKFLEKIQ